MSNKPSYKEALLESWLVESTQSRSLFLRTKSPPDYVDALSEIEVPPCCTDEITSNVQRGFKLMVGPPIKWLDLDTFVYNPYSAKIHF